MSDREFTRSGRVGEMRKRLRRLEHKAEDKNIITLALWLGDLQKPICWLFGHDRMMDQCCHHTHDFCPWCHTRAWKTER